MLKILQYFNLGNEVEDYEKIHSTIEKDLVFRGTNLWILVLAIMVASVGLNMNSTAVIIGAMLISPLMGPINGIGYGIATYNFALLRRALKNFGFAVGTSLITSTFYFLVSPVSSAQSEILARTSPTIYDVLIALFGGMAGILAIGSKQKGNVIPGVAIATALMPPLCTAGYGLATGKFIFFFGAFYLFIINTVFIAISSIIISRVLKFPSWTFVDEQKKRRTHRIVSTIIALTIIPSIYFGFGLVQNERFTENASRFIQTVSTFEGSYLLKSEIRAGKREVTLVFGGNELTQQGKSKIREQARHLNLDPEKVEIKQGFSFSGITEGIKEADQLRGELNRMHAELAKRQQVTDSLENRRQLGKQLFAELQPIFPQVTKCTYAETREYSAGSPSGIRVAVFTVETKRKMDKKDKARLEEWLKARTGMTRVKVFFN